MNTLKSAALVIVLAGVLYGVYVTLHQPPAPPPPGMTKDEVDSLGPPQVEVATAGTDERLASSGSSLGTEKSPAAMDAAFPGIDSKADTSGSAFSLPESLPPAPNSGGGLNHSPAPPAESTDRNAHTRTALEAPVGNGGTATRAGGAGNLTEVNFKRDWLNAKYMVEEGKFRDALATLTPYYRSPDLSDQTQVQLIEWLDALAAKVIYSKEHLLASPHVVQSEHERLIDIAARHGVTAQLLVSINADEINNPDILLPTTRLKMVPGPFRADVDLTRNEITVFLGNLYAGRFPFVLGNEPPQPGEYQVREKRQDRTYFGERVIAAGDPSNPYGQWWIDLGGSACIHGSPAANLPGPVRGCISLSPQDAQDMAAILTVGSKVSVRR